jgi:excisionase family DNA binding protein
MYNLLTIQSASEMLGVTTKTLRRWEEEGRIKPTRTKGGHRRYAIQDLIGGKKDKGITICYARVSSHDQKEDLKRQCSVLESFAAAQGFTFELIQDLGSGMNYKKKGLNRLLKLLCTGNIDRLVITHKDRLLRFGSELIFAICEIFGIEVVIINKSVDSSYEEDLTSDVLEIITVFSARLYGSRSHKNKNIMEQLKVVSENIK